MNFPLQDSPSTRPYLLRALHEWCCDNGFTPYLAVRVDASVQVPMAYVKNHEIVLNVSVDSTSGLRLGNDFIEFKARFGGVVCDIMVPVSHVLAIYARENGQGMAFTEPFAGTASASDNPPLNTFPSSDVGHSEPVAGTRPPLRSVPSELQEDAPHGDAEDGDPEPPPASASSAHGRKPVLKRVK